MQKEGSSPSASCSVRACVARWGYKTAINIQCSSVIFSKDASAAEAVHGPASASPPYKKSAGVDAARAPAAAAAPDDEDAADAPSGPAPPAVPKYSTSRPTLLIGAEREVRSALTPKLTRQFRNRPSHNSATLADEEKRNLSTPVIESAAGRSLEEAALLETSSADASAIESVGPSMAEKAELVPAGTGSVRKLASTLGDS